MDTGEKIAWGEMAADLLVQLRDSKDIEDVALHSDLRLIQKREEM